MDLRDAMNARRSIRQYKTDPIPEEVFPRLMEALSLAPSANNGQPCHFLFVRDAKVREQVVKKACHQEGFLNAPLIVVACCKKGREFDCAIAVENLVLAATAEGLGSCWVGWIEREEMRKILGIPEEMDIPVVIPIGYAAERPDARPRKPLVELVRVV